MADKRPPAKKVRRRDYASDEEYIEALIQQNRLVEADNYRVQKGLN